MRLVLAPYDCFTPKGEPLLSPSQTKLSNQMTTAYVEMTPPEECVISRVLESRAATHPSHPFMVAQGRTFTYGELNASANQVAHGLRALGVERGDRVAVLMESSAQYLDVWFAIAKLGAVEIPVNIAYKGEILRHILASSGTTTIVCDAQFSEIVRAVVNECPTVSRCVVRGAPADLIAPVTVALDDVYAPATGNLDIEVSYTDLGCIMFTSGTTGVSKGVMINHHLLWSYGVNYAEIVRMTEADNSYNYLPFFHVAGKFVLMAAMLVNARMVLVPRLSVSDFWRDVRAHGATLMVAVGGVCHMLYSQTPMSDDADNPLRMIYAVPVPAEFQSQFESRFDLVFVEGYGSTEMNIVACSQPGSSPPGSFGRALQSYEIDIFDERDMPCPANVPGEIVVRPKRPHTIMEGYYGLPEKSLEVMRNLWLHSGDQGYRDENGWFFFLDRLTDSMRRRGENISSFEVERLINQHDGISEAAAVAVRSQLQEDEVKVVAVRNPDTVLTEESLLRYCVEVMPYFMVPRYIEFCDELPRTALTKVRKVELRAAGVTDTTWDCEAHGWRVTRNGLVEI